jgi:hypothetical protein
MINGHTIEAPRAQRVELRTIKADMAALKAHWPWLREKLLIIKRNNEYPDARDRPHGQPKGDLVVRGRTRWTPEQVRFEIMRGIGGQSSVELFFFVGPDFEGRDDEIKGFTVSTCNMDPFLHCPVDFVAWLGWLAYPGLTAAIERRLEDLARERGCTAMEHSSPREGWSKWSRWLGYNLKYVTWRKELV